MLSLTQLRKTLTRTEGLAFVLEKLTALGFDATSWQDGSIQKTLMMTLGVVVADFSEVAKAIVEFGSNIYSSGDALNEFSKSRFDNEKVAAVKTRGPMTLTSTASVPYVIEPGQLIAATSSGIEFRNATGGTLSAGSVASPSTLVLTWDARVAGSQGNVALNAVNRLLTPLAGVTVANSTGTPWYTTAGADEESDTSIRARNTTKWSTLTVELVAESYEAIARSGGALKVKVHDANPRGPGTIDVYSAGEYSLLGTSTMEAIQLAFSQRAFQTDDDWPAASDSRVSNEHPDTYELDITATIYHDPGVDGSDIQDSAEEALNDFLRLTPIGGWDFSPGPANVVLVSQLIEVLEAVEGVESVVLTTPSGTLSIGTLALVIEGTWTLTPVAVT